MNAAKVKKYMENLPIVNFDQAPLSYRQDYDRCLQNSSQWFLL